MALPANIGLAALVAVEEERTYCGIYCGTSGCNSQSRYGHISRVNARGNLNHGSPIPLGAEVEHVQVCTSDGQAVMVMRSAGGTCHGRVNSATSRWSVPVRAGRRRLPIRRGVQRGPARRT